MKILFLSGWYPYPANNGSKMRVSALLRGLSAQHDVTLLSFYHPDEGEPQLAPLLQYCRRVEAITWHEYRPARWKALLGFFFARPRWLVDTYSAEMAGAIRAAVDGEDFDLVIASQVVMASYRACFRDLPALLEEMEIGIYVQKYRQAETLLKRLRYGLTWWKQKVYLERLLSGFQGVTVVSELERALLLGAIHCPIEVDVVPNGIELQNNGFNRGELSPNTMIFSGSFRYFANHEAMVWFTSKVLPIVRTAIPEARLIITGDHANLPLPVMDGVELTGYLDDVRPEIASSWISLAPLRSGGGTRLKILEAMSLGTPVVATSKGAEGLDVRHGEHLLIADEPESFAREVIKLLQDSRLRSSLSTHAEALIRQRYHWDAILPGFLSIIKRIAAGSNGLQKR